MANLRSRFGGGTRRTDEQEKHHVYGVPKTKLDKILRHLRAIDRHRLNLQHEIAELAALSFEDDWVGVVVAEWMDAGGVTSQDFQAFIMGNKLATKPARRVGALRLFVNPGPRPMRNRLSLEDDDGDAA